MQGKECSCRRQVSTCLFAIPKEYLFYIPHIHTHAAAQASNMLNTGSSC